MASPMKSAAARRCAISLAKGNAPPKLADLPHIALFLVELQAGLATKIKALEDRVDALEKISKMPPPVVSAKPARKKSPTKGVR
jgi:hypothetical protein